MVWKQDGGAIPWVMYCVCKMFFFLKSPTVPYGNSGCSGGSQEMAILYVIDNDGIATEKSYPYTENVS